MHNSLLKEVNGDNKYVRFTGLRYNNFEVLAQLSSWIR